MYKIGNDWAFDKEEVKSLLKGKVNAVKCWGCNGKGWVWVDGAIGEVVIGHPDESREEEFYKDCCEECGGLGVFIHFLED